MGAGAMGGAAKKSDFGLTWGAGGGGGPHAPPTHTHTNGNPDFVCESFLL